MWLPELTRRPGRGDGVESGAANPASVMTANSAAVAGAHLTRDSRLPRFIASSPEPPRSRGGGRKGSRGGRPVTHDADLYRERNTVERLINRLKDWRGIATRFDKTPASYLAGLELRASMIWLGDLLQAAY